jgi:EAL domain-containing protein (putative c-di-GMP-specific phosphodiesterase class I)
MNTPHKILLIDDDNDVGEVVTAAAEGLGMQCIATTSPNAFFEALTPETSLIFLDLVMPELDGIELLRILSQRESTPRIVLMSGIGKRIVETAHTLGESLGLTIAGHLDKPFRLIELEELLTRQIETQSQPIHLRQTPIDIEEAELVAALDRVELVLHYQPQIDLASGHVYGVEALVRWHHPARGLIFPDAFIPLAERRSLIDRLGWIVFHRGLSEINQFKSSAGMPLTLSLNVSVQSLRDLTFPDRFIAMAHACAVTPARVVLEITEGGLIQELSSSLDVLTRLRMKNVQLSIDDFGTGYSMLAQLRNIPATELKIDRSFVREIHSSSSDRIMVQKTIEIGHELGMKVIAEGVEDAEQLQFLRANHCDHVQGYLFSKPVPPPVLEKWLAAYHPLNA